MRIRDLGSGIRDGINSDPGSGMEKCRIRDPGSGINIPDPQTLKKGRDLILNSFKYEISKFQEILLIFIKNYGGRLGKICCVGSRYFRLVPGTDLGTTVLSIVTYYIH
jgi:hypothetical protein